MCMCVFGLSTRLLVHSVCHGSWKEEGEGSRRSSGRWREGREQKGQSERVREEERMTERVARQQV